MPHDSEPRHLKNRAKTHTKKPWPRHKASPKDRQFLPWCCLKPGEGACRATRKSNQPATARHIDAPGPTQTPTNPRNAAYGSPAPSSSCSQVFPPPVIVTRSAMVERDQDLLAPMAAKGLVKAYFPNHPKPRANTTHETTRHSSTTTPVGHAQTSNSRYPVGVMFAPVIPAPTNMKWKQS